MVSRDGNQLVIWPSYFEQSLSRGSGRRVSQSHTREKPPTLEEIAKAAKSLGLNPVIEKAVAHPARPWKKEGRVLVDKKGSKQKTLLQISNRL